MEAEGKMQYNEFFFFLECVTTQCCFETKSHYNKTVQKQISTLDLRQK